MEKFCHRPCPVPAPLTWPETALSIPAGPCSGASLEAFGLPSPEDYLTHHSLSLPRMPSQHLKGTKFQMSSSAFVNLGAHREGWEERPSGAALCHYGLGVPGSLWLSGLRNGHPGGLATPREAWLGPFRRDKERPQARKPRPCWREQPAARQPAQPAGHT